MSVKDGATVNQEGIAAVAGISNAAAVKLSGADLMHAALLAKAGTTAGPGKDGARLAQLAGGSKVP